MTTTRERLERLERRATSFEKEVLAALRRSIRAGTKGLGQVVSAALPAEPYVSLDDLAAIETAWQAELRDTIMPELGRIYEQGALDAIGDLARQVPVTIDSRHPAAEVYLLQADSRLRNVGATTWQRTRAQLVDGLAEGESIPQLSRRVRSVLASSTVRAATIARTEVISASNAGALAQMQAMGVDAPTKKIWLATGDKRTRLSHRAADGQVRELSDKFSVGDTTLGFPGDPTGVADEVINCRCTMVWDFDSRSESLVAATDPEPHTSGMVALIPQEPVAIEGGEPPEESHLTLWFLGEVAAIPEEVVPMILGGVRRKVADWPVIEATAFGAAVWNPHGEDPCVVLNVGGPPELAALRQDIGEVLHGWVGWQMPEQHQPWAPHLCLVYDDNPVQHLEAALEQVGPVVFDRVRLALGDEIHDFKLGGD